MGRSASWPDRCCPLCRRWSWRSSSEGLLLLLERSDVVHHVPDVIILGTVVLGRHVGALAIPRDVEELTVGTIFQRIRIGEIGNVFEVPPDVALAVAAVSVTHRAVDAIHLLTLGEGLCGGLHRIYLGRLCGGNLGFRGGSFCGGLILLRP